MVGLADNRYFPDSWSHDAHSAWGRLQLAKGIECNQEGLAHEPQCFLGPSELTLAWPVLPSAHGRSCSPCKMCLADSRERLPVSSSECSPGQKWPGLSVFHFKMYCFTCDDAHRVLTTAHTALSHFTSSPMTQVHAPPSLPARCWSCTRHQEETVQAPQYRVTIRLLC